jgi:hypothetical protein
MAQFLLLVRDRGSEMFAGLSREDIQRIIQRYIDWGATRRAPPPSTAARSSWRARRPSGGS